MTTSYKNILSSSQGAKILFATDEWFSSCHNLISDNDPLFISDLYCSQGKVMDGWETRRKRIVGHDWCLISLAPLAGGTKEKKFKRFNPKIEVDTAYFTGNHAPHISIQLGRCLKKSSNNNNDIIEEFEKKIPKRIMGQGTCSTPQDIATTEELLKSSSFEWYDILPKTKLNPGVPETRHHTFTVNNGDDDDVDISEYTHVRINYYPDGGVARIRIWANEQEQTQTLLSPPSSLQAHPTTKENNNFLSLIDLACELNGGKGLMCSNKHYGEPSNLIQASEGKDMGDGWETARHPNRPSILLDRGDGLVDFQDLNDWCILKLGGNDTSSGGLVQKLIVDTKHFKGNFPESVMIEGCTSSSYGDDDSSQSLEKQEWFPLLNRVKMSADSQHVFTTNDGVINSNKRVTHVRVTMWPDGGISRVRVFCSKGQEDSDRFIKSHL